MKFEILEFCSIYTKKKVKCAVIRTEDSYFLVTIFDDKTSVYEYKSKRKLIKEILQLKIG